MACVSFSGGIANDCLNNQGGVTKLYLADFGDILSYTESGGTVSSIGMSASKYFYEFTFNRNSATLTEDLTKSIEAGSVLYDQKVVVTLPRRDANKRAKLALLANRDLGCVVKDANGIYWYLGAVEGVYASTLTSTSGTNRTDGSNYVMTLQGFEVAQAFTLTSATVITSLLAP